MSIGQLIEHLESQRFFGALELKFENGRLVLVRKTETIKPESISNRDSRGVSNGQH